MRSSIALTIAFAGLTAAQSSSDTGTGTASAPIPTESLSPCVFTCSQQAVQSAGCSSLLDTNCICADDNNFQIAAASCLSQQCPDQMPQALQYQEALCDAAGSSSAPATAGATATQGGTITSSLAMATSDISSSSVAGTSSVAASASSLVSSLSSAVASVTGTPNAAIGVSSFDFVAVVVWGVVALGGVAAAQLVL